MTATVVRKRHWLIAFLFAAAAHLALLGLIVEPPPSGALAPGERGLEIGLGPSGGAPGAVSATTENETLEPAETEALEAAEEQEESLLEAEPEITEALPEPPPPEEVPSELVASEEAPLESQPLDEPLVEQLAEVAPEPEAVPLESEMAEPEVTAMVEAETALAAELSQEEPPQEEPPPAPAAAPPPKPYREPPPQMAAAPRPPPAPAPAQPSPPEPAPSSPAPTSGTQAPNPEPETGNQGRSGSDSSRDSGDGSDTSAGADPGAERDYYALLLAWLERHKDYPREARARRREGTAMLQVEMDRNGRVLSYGIRQSAGHGVLDSAVEQMIRRAQPLPPLPPEMPQQRLSFVVPVEFRLR